MIFVQPNMQAQEELSALFSRNLSLEQPAEPPKEEPVIVYISQHYNHSAHIAPPQQHVIEEEPAQEAPRAASEPPLLEHAAADALLRNYGVDPSCLSASQLELFKSAEDAQKERLIQLWRICPPTNIDANANAKHPALAWNSTSLEHEEILARARYEQQQAAERLAQQEQEETMSLDDGMPSTPIQGGDGRWNGAVAPESYMASGYEQLARREYEDSARSAFVQAVEMRDKGYYTHATDPVYQMTNVGTGWGFPGEDEEML